MGPIARKQEERPVAAKIRVIAPSCQKLREVLRPFLSFPKVFHLISLTGPFTSDEFNESAEKFKGFQ